MIDRSTILGLAATLALLAWVMADGHALGASAFWRGSAAALVAGGAVFTTLMAFPWRRFRAGGGILRNVVVERTRPPEELIAAIVPLAQAARRDGLLALEKPVEALSDGFLRRAMRMAVDGVDARTIEQICRTELEATDARHASGSALLETLGRAAPVFGMMGTVIGLVVMLGTLDDPAKIGPGMSVALLTTLYGLLLANVLCLPLARKLTHRSSEELLNKTIALAGVLAIQAGDNPRIVEQKLRAYLPAGGREAEPAASPAAASRAPARGRHPLRWLGANLRGLRPFLGLTGRSRHGRALSPAPAAGSDRPAGPAQAGGGRALIEAT